MLIEATFENLLSFDKPTTFSMVAGKITKQHKDHVRKVAGTSVLRGAILYGANAAGKTNVIKALALFNQMLLTGDCGAFLGNRFLLSAKPRSDMMCELVVSNAEHVFRYHATTDGKTIRKESLWLISPTGDELLFDRSNIGVRRGPMLDDPWYQWRTVQDKTPYLSKLVSDGLFEHRRQIPNSDILIEAVMALRFVVPLSFVASVSIVPMFIVGGAGRFKDFLKDLLVKADAGITGVTGIPLSKKTLESLPLATAMSRPDMDILMGSTSELSYGFSFNGKYIVLSRSKSGFKGEEIQLQHGLTTFPPEAESEGTRRLVEYAPLFLFLRETPAAYLVDEFDSHLHPALSKFLLETVFATAHPEAQFIVTAHDTTLMTHDLWRTDEIWFAEKRQDGSTDLYSMYNFTPRFDKNLEKGYRQGLYGAVPFPGGEWRR